MKVKLRIKLENINACVPTYKRFWDFSPSYKLDIIERKTMLVLKYTALDKMETFYCDSNE